MTLLCWSLKQNVLTSHQRGQLAVSQNQLPDILKHLKSSEIEEIILVSTCQRFQFYVVTSNPELTRQNLNQWCQQRANFSSDTISFSQCLTADSAAFHLFEIAAGLKSIVLGEVEILGQLRRSWKAAQENGFTGPHLNGLFHHALRTGRTVRHHTDICRGAQTLESSAIEKGLKTATLPSELCWLVIGTGQMGQTLLRQLKHRQIHKVRAVNRSARPLDPTAEVHPEPWSHLQAAIEWADIIVTCTSASKPLVNAQNLSPSPSSKTLIDLSLPANIDPQLKNNPVFKNFQWWDLVTLHEELLKQQHYKQTTLNAVRHFLFKGWQRYEQWHRERDLAPFLRVVYAHTRNPKLNTEERQVLRRRLHTLVCGFKYSKAPQLRSHYHTQILELLRSA